EKLMSHVLLTCYHSHKMAGCELLDLSQAMWPELPVILATSDVLVTGHATHRLLEPAYGVFEKPFERGTLLGTIRADVDGLPKPVAHDRRQSQPAYQAFA